MRIRHYGITANRRRQEKLTRSRELLGVGHAAPTDTDSATHTAEVDTATSPADSSAKRCPNCGAPLRIIEVIPATRRDLLGPATALPDTS